MIDIQTPDQSEKFAALAREHVAPELPDPPLLKKLPMFGKLLLQARRCGEHPDDINVVYGERWRGVSPPKLCVRPIEYRPGVIDWRVVAGVRVFLHDLGKGLTDFNVMANQFGNFYALIGELVAMDAYVVVRYPDAGEWRSQGADDLAYACRYIGRWPSWWSDDLDRRQKAAYFGWLKDQERNIRRKTECGQGQ